MAKYSNLSQIFFDDIFKENPYDGYILFYAQSREWDPKKHKYIPVMFKTWFCKTSEVHDYIDKLYINPNLDYYFSLNSYKNPKGKENMPTNRKDHLFSFNGIVIDIDCHYSERLIEKDFDDVMALVESYSLKYHLPQYSYIVKTGRGLQIYYLFKPCSSKLNFLVDMAKEHLLTHYKKMIAPMPQFLIDAGASKRYSGIFRMPYTFNQATHTEAIIKYWDNVKKIDINDFLNKILLSSEHITPKTLALPNKQTSDNKESDPNPPNIARCSKVLREIEKYQTDIIAKKSGHENRNRTCLIYASFLLNVYSTDIAINQLKEFNNRYMVPLSEQRLNTILSYLLENHTNKNKLSLRYFSNAKILEMLEISSGEYNIIVTDNYHYNSFITNDSSEERIRKKKEKANKKKRAVALLNKGFTYTEISQKTGLSISTISRINKQKNGPSTKVKDLRPWEKEGISRATYYRNRKK